MPVTPTYPGVYIDEIPSGVRTLIGVGTSITAFVGQAPRGPVNSPITIFSYGDYERTFGGLSASSSMSYAVYHYFLNGGSTAIIVRALHTSGTGVLAVKAASIPTIPFTGGSTNTVFTALNEGVWGNYLFFTITHDSTDATNTTFNLTLRERAGTNTTDPIVREENYYNLSVDPNSTRYALSIVNGQSNLATITSLTTVKRPVDAAETRFSVGGGAVAGVDGDPIPNASLASEFIGSTSNKVGIYALEKADLFNILCIPPILSLTGNTDSTVWTAALAYCKLRRAILLVDPPNTWTDLTTGANGILNSGTGVDGSTPPGTSAYRDENAALYFPRIIVQDTLKGNQPLTFVPCGAVAGVMARTDANRGVWKAPAGMDTRLAGVTDLALKLTDSEQGQLNPLGVNVIRNLPIAGNVIWGARTLEGADRLASDWKYLPVRRLALYIEESLYRGTQWAVFEPNDEPLWAQIRLNLGAFMHQLFRQGAFQGAKPSESYFVKCDSSTTTQNDINQGVVNIIVGFAPLKPAEFVIIKLQQMAGQIQS